jgi:molybdenum cofactor biosynthesis protein B
VGGVKRAAAGGAGPKKRGARRPGVRSGAATPAAGGTAAPKRVRRVERSGEHRAATSGPRPVVCAVITVSDTRRGKADQGGALLAGLLEQAGHRVGVRAWVKDEPREIRRAAAAALERADIDCVILTGGTGLSPRDQTPESLDDLIEKPLPGFGELFRVFSFEQVGPAAWLSRAAAGIARGRLVVTLPGSLAAVELALRQLLLPELVHAIRALGRFPSEE